MRPAQPSRKPTFIWQAGLILLPVVVLTAVGLFSLEQDRRLTEQDAQTAGATIARRLAGAMNSAMVRQLGEYHTAIIDLHATWNIALGLSTSPGGATMPDVKARIDTWQKANPDID